MSNTHTSPAATCIVTLGDARSTAIDVAGGKGASLGRLIGAGFPVPPGFVVCTDAYAACLRENDLDREIAAMLASIDFADVDDLEARTAQIQSRIAAAPMPADVIEAITAAYGVLGDDPWVAVRSSGTAEDLEGASFAGQYDTYLDVRGVDAVVDAVRRCWASMWTARVTAYRQDRGFDHLALGIAVIVQSMVDADVAGVMFTGNPMNARADELAINASWGLGEAVVSGMVTPDEFVVGRDSLGIRRRSLGSKALRVVRDRDTGFGTRREDVDAGARDVFCLTDAQVADLASLGRRVMAFHEGLPQDVEWALADGALFLLQSRPVTGVHFTWEEDLDLWPDVPEDDDLIWSRAWADMVWHGAVTPLFWTVRGSWLKGVGAGLGMGPLLGDRGDIRWLKFHRGTVYYNTEVDERIAETALPRTLRGYAISRVHPSRVDKVMAAPFDLDRMLERHERATARRGGAMPNLNAAYEQFRPFVKGGARYEARRAGLETPYPIDPEFFHARVDTEKLGTLADDELFDRVWRIVEGMGAHGRSLTDEAIENAPPPYGLYVDAALEYIVDHWYDGDNPNAYTEMISGVQERTQQGHDDYDFWSLAKRIRDSETLSRLVEEHEGAAFFEALAEHEEGRAFLEEYEDFLIMNGCRGHADRDIYYPRRIEDPMIDYQALRLLVSADELVSPDERDAALRRRREAATADVLDNLSRQPFGELKAAVLTALLDITLKRWTWRDDERPMGDTMTWSKKVLLKELGRRTVERGLLQEERDFYFLGLEELRGLLAGTEPVALARAKVAARALDFDRFLAREADTPLYLKGRDAMPDLDAQAPLGEGSVLRGTGTSPGSVSGRARIVPALDGIGRLEPGDILICNSTDPGWTPVFSIVAGIVGETGGMAAHFSCLSREYGMPAVSLPNAMRLIEDGAMVTINGSTGEVRLAS